MPFVRKVCRRDEVYEAVWTVPMNKAASQFGVSLAFLKRTCRRLEVPFPEAGYWNRRPDRRPPRPSLPPLADGKPSEVSVEQFVRTDNPSPMPAGSLAAIARETETEWSIRVAPTLDAPHRLVEKTQRQLSRSRTDERGMKVRGDLHCLDVDVSTATLERALRIFDALIKALEARSLSISVIERPEPQSDPHRYRPRREASVAKIATAAVVDGRHVHLHLSEQCDVDRPDKPTPPRGLSEAEAFTWNWKHPRPPPRYRPNGVLELEAVCGDQGATWRDGKRRNLEDCLNAAVAQLFVLAHRQADADEDARRAEARRAEEERRRWEQSQRDAEDRMRLDRLQARLDRWRLAGRIREYVAATRTVIAEGGCRLIEASELATELRWAEGYADRIDPIALLRGEMKQVRGERGPQPADD